MKKYGIDAVPFKHPELQTWRDDFYRYMGASVHHEPTNFLISGIIDDLWTDNKGNLIVVDYKATSTSKEISLEDKWKQGYKKQMEVYQWIFRKKGFEVSDTGYFIFANALRSRNKFDGKLEFALSILPYTGDDSWIEPALFKIKEVLMSEEIPSAGDCSYCDYRNKASLIEIP